METAKGLQTTANMMNYHYFLNNNLSIIKIFIMNKEISTVNIYSISFHILSNSSQASDFHFYNFILNFFICILLFPLYPMVASPKTNLSTVHKILLISVFALLSEPIRRLDLGFNLKFVGRCVEIVRPVIG